MTMQLFKALLASASLAALFACTSGSEQRAAPQTVADTIDVGVPTQLPRT